jgi:hypothetical protein
MKPGKPKKESYEYNRNDTCCAFIAFDPHEGKRANCVNKHSTKVDHADFMKGIALRYPDAESIKVVQYNLNTNPASSFYEAFLPEESFELATRFELHFTQKRAVVLIWQKLNYLPSLDNA